MSQAEDKNINRRQFEQGLIAKAWKDENFKRELSNNPKIVYERELNQKLPDSLEIKVVEETPEILYLVIPNRVKNVKVTEELSDDALEAVAGGWAVSVAVAVGGIVDF